MDYYPRFVFFAGFVLCVYFGTYVHRLNPTARANRVFLLVCACCAAWFFSYTLTHSLVNREDAWAWYRVSLAAGIFFPVFLAHFFLSLTRPGKIPGPLVFLLLYLPGALFLALGPEGERAAAGDLIRRGGLWTVVYSGGGPLNAAYFTWRFLVFGLCLGLIARRRKRSAGKKEARHAGVLLFAGVPAAVTDLLTGAVFPYAAIRAPDLSPAAGAIWAAGIWYAVTRHGLLSITPKIAFDSILGALAEGLILTDPGGTVKWLNRSAAEITGYSPSELSEQRIDVLFPDSEHAPGIVHSGLPFESGEGVLARKNGGKIPVSLNAAMVRRGELLIGYVFSFADITERRKVEEEIRHISYHDRLTGLYNRFFAEQEMERLDERHTFPVCAIICDVNGLKAINDSLGHTEGDTLIKKAAETIRISCRKDDIIARWGGDEFLILLPGAEKEQARQLARRIIANCPPEAGGGQPSLSLSAGVAARKNPDEHVLEVIKRADAMMYRNKHAYKNNHLPPG